MSLRALRKIDACKVAAIPVGVVALLVRAEGAANSAIVPYEGTDLRNIDAVGFHPDPVTIQANLGEDILLGEGDLARLPIGNYTRKAISIFLLEPLWKALWIPVARRTIFRADDTAQLGLELMILVLRVLAWE